MGVEGVGLGALAEDLDLVVGGADAAGVPDDARGGRARLRLDDLVDEARVDARGGHVRRVAAVGAQGRDEVAVVLLLQDRLGIEEDQRLDEVCFDGAVVVGRDGDVVGGYVDS